MRRASLALDSVGHASGAASASAAPASCSIEVASNCQNGHCLWEKDPSWQRYIAALATFPGVLKVLECCGGLSTGCVALSKLLPSGAVEMAGHWDIDECLRPFLEVVHRQCRCIHLGKDAGDLLQLDIGAIALGHVLIAGPPCPPWSSLGSRGSFEDRRASVFWRVVDIVVDQARRGPLALFVLENVEAILHHAKGAQRRAIDVILEELWTGLPSGWQITVHTLNTRDFGLPQSRPRAYVVGHRCDLFGPQPMPPPIQFERTVQLKNLLNLADKRNCWPNTTVQAQNLRDWKQHYGTSMNDSAAIGTFAVIDISRTPSGRTRWTATSARPGIVQCLTAAGPDLHVFSLGEGNVDLSLDRRLRGSERASLQGFPPCVRSVADEGPRTKRILGNAMSVPVIGSVLGTAMLRLVGCSSPRSIVAWTGSSNASSASSTAGAAPPAEGSDGIDGDPPDGVTDTDPFTHDIGEGVSAHSPSKKRRLHKDIGLCT